MKLPILLLLLIIAGFLTGCFSTKVLVKPAEETTAYCNTTYFSNNLSFQELIRNTQFDYLQEMQLNKDELVFSNALNNVIEGNIANAGKEFIELYQTSNDTLIQSLSFGITNSLLLFQSKWSELLKLYSENTDTLYSDNSYTNIAKAYLNAPTEEYLFQSNNFTMPLQLSKTGSPVIQITINGEKKNFWLDTGAGLSVISSDIASECNISPLDLGGKKAMGATATSKKVGFYPAIINDLEIGNLQIKNHPVVIIDKKDLEIKVFGIRLYKIDGIIGWNAIQNMDINIDYREKQLTVKQPLKKTNIQRNFFWLGIPVVKVKDTSGNCLNFFFDTGANSSSITDNLLSKINIGSSKTKTVRIGSAGGIEKIHSATLSDFKLIINNYSVTFPDIGTQPDGGSFLYLDGTLGSDIVQNGSVRIDWLNGIFELNFTE